MSGHRIFADLYKGKNINAQKVVDPGNGGTIFPALTNGTNFSAGLDDARVALVIAVSTAETRVLADPETYNIPVGVQITLNANTVGANGTCTVNGAYLNVAGQVAKFEVIETSGTRSWGQLPDGYNGYLSGNIRVSKTAITGFAAASQTNGANTFIASQAGGAGDQGAGFNGGNFTFTAGQGSSDTDGSSASGKSGSILFVTQAGKISDDSGGTGLPGSIVLKAPGGVFFSQGAPDAQTGDFTVTIARMLGSLVKATKATAIAATLDTGTAMDAGVPIADLGVDVAFDWWIINTGSSSGVVTVGTATDHTLIGLATVAINTTAHFRSRRTGTHVWETYRLGE